jgi:RNA 3'-phosphate cyclase
MIELDGSFEEGGGQILRTALGLSVLTQKPFRIINIRKNREEPGLKQQHVSCVKACAEISNANADGNKIGSETLEFIPRVIKNRQMEINIGTAGSISLVFQSLMLPIMFTEADIKITGGTDVKWSIPIDYLKNIIVPILVDYCNMQVNLEKRGYYPAGNGVVSISNKPLFRRLDFDSFQKFHQYIFGNPSIRLFEEGKIIGIKGISHASSELQERKVAERQADAAKITLGNITAVNIQREYAKTDSIGSGIMIYAMFQASKNYRLGSDVLGEKNLKSEEVGKNACDKLKEYIDSGLVVDECLQDNIIPLLGLFGGRIKTGKITKHTLANIYTCEKFLGVNYIIEKSNQKSNQSEANFISVLSSSKS